MSREYSSEHQSIHAQHQEMVENLTLTSPLAAPPDLVQEFALTHIHCCSTRYSRHPHKHPCIHVLALCLRAGSHTHMYSALTYTSACSLLPSHLCVYQL